MIARPRCTFITPISPPPRQRPNIGVSSSNHPCVAVQVQAFHTRRRHTRCEMSHGLGIKSDILHQPPSSDKSPERSYRNPSKPRFLSQRCQLYPTHHADAITDCQELYVCVCALGLTVVERPVRHVDRGNRNATSKDPSAAYASG